ncbi:MAG: hypothetical protein NVSMB56_17730 [Pyrinomonadaceae bacterium]
MKKILTLATLALGLSLSIFFISSRFLTTNAAAFDDYPPTSKTQPENAPLGRDSKSPKWGEVAFNHKKHAEDPLYSVDGKAKVTCTECHHTDQPAAGKCGASAKGVGDYKTFERKVCLTTEELAKADSAPVKSCGSCHFQKGLAPAGKTMPTSSKGDLDNLKAFHVNCIECHKQAKDARSDLDDTNAPTKCATCHKTKE